MSIEKEKLLSIRGLASLEVINSMDSKQYDMYCSALFDFIETFPSLEESLKKSFRDKDYAAFSRTFSKVRELLVGIGAIGLEISCRRLAEELESKKYNLVESHLVYLLAEISGVSIDVQMARHEGIATMPASFYDSNRVGQKNILAVDDVSLLLFRLKDILQKTDYKFTGVISGAAALKFVEKYTPDMFILDIAMPGMDGYELAKRLRQCGQTAPIIFLTGNASVEYVRKAIEVGASDFIVKPINEKHVLEKIRKYI